MIKIILLAAFFIWIGIKIGQHSKASWIGGIFEKKDDPRRR